MTWKVLAAIGLCATVVTGCVSTGTHEKTLGELEEARKTSAQTAGTLASLQKQSAEDIKNLEVEQGRLTKGILLAQRGLEETQSDLETTQHHLVNVQEARRKAERELAQLREERDFLQSNVEDLTQRLSMVEQALASSKELLGEAHARVASLEQEEARLTNELSDAQDTLAHTQRFLESAEQRLASQERGRREAETNVVQLEENNQRLEQLGDTLRRERDFYQATVEDLHQELERAPIQLAGVEKQLDEARGRMADLELEGEGATAAFTEAQNRAEFLEASLAEERAQVAGLEEDNQRLMTAARTAEEGVAHLAEETAEPQIDTARIDDLERQLGERDRLIGELRQTEADRESLTAEVAALTGEVEQAEERIIVPSDDLAALSDEVERLRQERAELSAQVSDLQEAIQGKDLALARSNDENNLLQAQLDQEPAAKETDIDILTATREELPRLAEMKEAERARLEKELREALDAEIAKGQIRIQQLRDRLMIDVLDRVLFDSGRAQIKQTGLEVLNRVTDILKEVTDKRIRIEGHTDTVPIGPTIIDQFPTNWELSTARATSVVRHLVDQGGLDEANLAAVGYAYNRPVASNDTTEGRAENRRIEIVLYPNDLSDIASF